MELKRFSTIAFAFTATLLTLFVTAASVRGDAITINGMAGCFYDVLDHKLYK